MALVPISRERHADGFWRPSRNFSFAAGPALIPLVGAELVRAIHAFPIAFLRKSGGYTLAAVVGTETEAETETGQNLFVDEHGQWLGSYIPSAVRCYPFSLGQTPEGTRILCLNDEEIVAAEDPAARPIYASDGTLGEETKRCLDILAQIEVNRVATEAACSLLGRAGLIEPWPLMVQTAQGSRTLPGLFRIRESALSGLEADRLFEIHRSGGLPILYGQLFSMQQTSRLNQLAAARLQRQQARQPEPSAAFLLPERDTIDFNW